MRIQILKRVQLIAAVSFAIVSVSASANELGMSREIRALRATRARLSAGLRRLALLSPPPQSLNGCEYSGRHGRASCYGPGLWGHPTASGERLRRGSMTAASRTVPLDSNILVVNRQTGVAKHARVNDRGPYIYSREMDLEQNLFMAVSGAAGCNGEVEILIYTCPNPGK